MKVEAAKLKRDMQLLEDEAEDRLLRDDLMEAERSLVSCRSDADLVVVPSGLEVDFSEAIFPEGGGGPVTWWAGSFADDIPVSVEGPKNV